MSSVELAPRFFIAVAAILLFCRAVAWALERVGQPPVVSEMIAGVMLGPSLLGLVARPVQEALFPDAVQPVLYVVGQVGLIVFMFQAGYEFAAHRVGGLASTAGAVSLAGVTTPLLLGVGLVVVADGHVPVTKQGVPLEVSALFVGVTLAVTAFPMLARIITERGHAGTRHGTLALASGAADDAAAWVLLAVIVGMASGRFGPAMTTALGATAFVAVMLTLGRRGARVLMGSDRIGREAQLLITLALLFAIAWYTDEIGLYAVFGAFLTGAVMPRTEPTEAVVASLAPIGRVLVPLFFTYSGLHTRFGLLGDPAVLAFAAACIAAAIVGKLGACTVAARLRGEPRGTALRVGVLMNSRGLMQLIALNVGREAGIVPPALFTVLVLVALVTTVMATPMMSWIERRERSREVEERRPVLAQPMSQ